MQKISINIILLVSFIMIPVMEMPDFITKLKVATISEDQKLPIIFHPKYDISLLGLENLHPFDTKKSGKSAQYIIQNIQNITLDNFYCPKHEVSQKAQLMQDF